MRKRFLILCAVIVALAVSWQLYPHRAPHAAGTSSHLVFGEEMASLQARAQHGDCDAASRG